MAVLVAALATLASACHALVIAVVACGTDADCADNELCNSGHDCVLAAPPVGGATVACAGTADGSADVALIDDFERTGGWIYDRGGRSGPWYTVNDGTGAQTPPSDSLVLPVSAPAAFGTGGHVLHTFGTGFTGWGALVGAKLNQTPTSDPAPYDASRYAGIRFTYTSATKLMFQVPTVATSMPPQGTCSTDCGSFEIALEIAPTPTTVEVDWKDLYQTFGAPAAFDPSQLSAIEWVFASGSPFDFWLDDVTFVTKCGADGGSDAGSTAPAFVVDDFEEGNTRGFPMFTGWTSYSYNPGDLMPGGAPGPANPGAFASVVSPGYASAFALELSFYMVDPPDGILQYPGAGVQTWTAVPSIDLSAYGLVAFAHRFDPSPPCEGTDRVMVEIDCSAWNTAFDGNVDVSVGAWALASVPFSSFEEQGYKAQTGIGITTCLSAADGMNFSVQSPPSDGECGAGHLQLDSIVLR
ncbi:MAG TPA: hypothetical protein VGM06_10655 [Polyangiaceae bacterium]